jgi:hypothetical protein
MSLARRLFLPAVLCPLGAVILLAGCTSQADPFSASNYAGAPDYRVHMVFRADESLMDDDVRLLPSDNRMLIAPGVLHLVVASHQDEVDSVMHFWCADREAADQLWARSRSAAIVVNGKIVDRTLVLQGESPRRRGQECSFAIAEDKTATCEAMAEAWGKDAKACRTPCPPWQNGAPPDGVCRFDLR